MRKICKLNEEQRQFADTHHSIVTRFLSHHQLDEAEFYDIVIFGYLLAVQEYLEKPELSRYAFSTIAWRNMKDCVAREYYNRSRDKRTAAIASLNEEVLELEAFLPRQAGTFSRSSGQPNSSDRAAFLYDSKGKRNGPFKSRWLYLP